MKWKSREVVSSLEDWGTHISQPGQIQEIGKAGTALVGGTVEWLTTGIAYAARGKVDDFQVSYDIREEAELLIWRTDQKRVALHTKVASEADIAVEQISEFSAFSARALKMVPPTQTGAPSEVLNARVAAVDRAQTVKENTASRIPVTEKVKSDRLGLAVLAAFAFSPPVRIAAVAVGQVRRRRVAVKLMEAAQQFESAINWAEVEVNLALTELRHLTIAIDERRKLIDTCLQIMALLHHTDAVQRSADGQLLVDDVQATFAFAISSPLLDANSHIAKLTELLTQFIPNIEQIMNKYGAKV